MTTHLNHDLLINKDNNLLDLTDDQLIDTFLDLAQISATCLAESLTDYSDSTTDDVMILTDVITSTLRVSTHDHGTSSRSTSQLLITALDNGLLDDLVHLKLANNSFDELTLARATIWTYLNEPTSDMLDNIG